MLATNWDHILGVDLPAIIAAIFSGVAMVIAAKNGRALRTPSGDAIGEVVERGHDLSAITVAATTGASGPVVDLARKRLNGGQGAQISHFPESDG